MTRWEQFEEDAPEMATEGKRLFEQFGLGLGFLATVRKDGGPRLHPICVIIAHGGLYAFILPSPKCEDLRRDGRFALHSYPPADTDDEFYLTGRAIEITDLEVRRAVDEAYQNPVSNDEALFEFNIERALLAKYRHRGDWPPNYIRWADPSIG
jgi:hypothetical protein